MNWSHWYLLILNYSRTGLVWICSNPLSSSRMRSLLLYFIVLYCCTLLYCDRGWTRSFMLVNFKRILSIFILNLQSFQLLSIDIGLRSLPIIFRDVSKCGYQSVSTVTTREADSRRLGVFFWNQRLKIFVPTISLFNADTSSDILTRNTQC